MMTTKVHLILAMLCYVAVASEITSEKSMKECPCDDASLCQPITGKRKEVFGFVAPTDHWQDYDWDLITTLAWVEDPELMCFAHSKGARVLGGGNAFEPVKDICSQAARDEYVQAQLTRAKDNFLDGINVDVEVAYNGTESECLTKLMEELSESFHREIPGSIVTVDVAWSPNNIDGRAYDYAGLGSASDYLFVMGYDTRSQIWDECVAGPNSALKLVQSGLQDYLDLGVDAEKLILGVPFYGYVYPCDLPAGTEMALDDSAPCPIKLVEFRGCPCSDAAGRQVVYPKIMEMWAQNKTGPVQHHAESDSFFYNMKTDEGYNQIWFDNSESLSSKCAMAKEMGIGGVGAWKFEQILGGSQTQQEAIWNSFRSFTEPDF